MVDLLDHLSFLLLLTLFLGNHVISVDPHEPLEVICPTDEVPDAVMEKYCDCVIKELRGESRILQVKCDFKNEKHTVLTDRFYAIHTAKFSSAYVRISNALSVRVTGAFMKEWQQAISSALDIWYSGKVFLSPSPPVTKHKSFKSFVGIGIIDCELPVVPSMLIRDHHRGALRMKLCTVGEMQAGFMHNIDELRYLVFEDCLLNNIKGRVSTEQSIALSSRELHSWNGLLMDNVTIGVIAEGAFNLTHRSDTEQVVLRDSKLGLVNSAAFTMAGDIAVNITDNVFRDIKGKAFQINTAAQVVFTGNTLQSWDPEVLTAVRCSAQSVLTNNTVMTSADDTNPQQIRLHPSCGTQQFQYVAENRAEKLSSSSSSSSTTGVVLALLSVVVVVAGTMGALWWYRGWRPWRDMARDTPLCEDQDQPDMSVTVAQFNQANTAAGQHR